MNSLEDPGKAGMEWRVLLAVVLSLACMFAYQYYMAPSTEVTEEPAVESEVPPPVPAEPQTVPDLSTAEPAAAALPETHAEPGEFAMHNADVELVWSNLRSGLRSIRLLHYDGTQDEALEVIPQGLPEEVTHPLEVGLIGVQNEVLREAVYEVESSPSGRVLSMRFRKGVVAVEREITLPESGYQLQVETSVSIEGRSSPYLVSLGAGLGNEWNASSYGDFSSQRIVFWASDGLTSYREGDLDEGAVTITRDLAWVGMDSHYFIYALVSPQITGVTALTEKSMHTPEEGEPVEATLLRADVQLGPGQSSIFFVGPKDSERLSAVAPTLPGLIDYGYLSLLVRPLVSVLKFVNGFVGNYGFSIIILTFFINVALFPIRYKQMTSMKKMSAVQPKLKAIQDKYKRMKRDDPRRMKMNEEVMALYKAEGVNPLAGCLPLLVQMPFLFAFYRMLFYTIELRGAPFIFWIHDLSKADPYYITPIVMGVTMVLQQKMTPMAGDPMQRRMMMFMPIMFTFFFLRVSSGLAIYFLFSNLFGITFQQAFQRLGKKEEVKPSGKPKGKKKRK